MILDTFNKPLRMDNKRMFNFAVLYAYQKIHIQSWKELNFI